VGKDLAVWATANPLAAIAVIGALSGGSIGILIALTKALPPLTAALRAYRGKNGNGNGHEHAPPAKRDEPTLSPGQFQLVTKDVMDAELGGQCERIEALERGVTGKGGTQERLAIVEATCTRVETDVKALPGAFRDMLQAQTIQLQEWQRKHMLAAFEAIEKQTDEKIRTALGQAKA
jgi:hypothetical protein